MKLTDNGIRNFFGTGSTYLRLSTSHGSTTTFPRSDQFKCHLFNFMNLKMKMFLDRFVKNYFLLS